MGADHEFPMQPGVVRIQLSAHSCLKLGEVNVRENPVALLNSSCYNTLVTCLLSHFATRQQPSFCEPYLVLRVLKYDRTEVNSGVFLQHCVLHALKIDSMVISMLKVSCPPGRALDMETLFEKLPCKGFFLTGN